MNFEQHTAGEYKRDFDNVSGENDDHGRDKFKQDLEHIHTHFKNFVMSNRPTLAIEKVATGEYWLGTEAQELAFVDELMTTDAYLMLMYTQKQVIAIQYQVKKTLKEKNSVACKHKYNKICCNLCLMLVVAYELKPHLVALKVIQAAQMQDLRELIEGYLCGF